jgi:hypothetical protein
MLLLVPSEASAKAMLDDAGGPAGCRALNLYGTTSGQRGGFKRTVTYDFSNELLKGSEAVSLISQQQELDMEVTKNYGRSRSVLVSVTQPSTEQLGHHTYVWMLVLLFHSMHPANRPKADAWGRLAAAIEGEQ